MSFSKLTDCLYVVAGGMFPRCNTVVIIADEVVVIDPGCDVEDLRRLLMFLDLNLKDISTVLLSHIHPDHITHAVRLHRLSNCRIAANEITAPLFNEKEAMKQFLGFNKSNPVRKAWEQLVNEKMYGALDEGRVDEVLSNGDKFNFGEITLRMLYSPGHLPDHMCIEFIEPNLVFASDIDLTEFGPFYGHPNSSINDFKDSIRKLQRGKYDGLISGHLKEPLVTDYIDRLTAYSRQFGIREDLILSTIIDGAQTIPEIAATPIIYPSLTNPVYLQFEKWMIEHHVASLVAAGLVSEEKGKLSPI
jgi:glyoxylase-like metal-dependent hydrolase (beta-lactamase superfamily II)